MSATFSLPKISEPSIFHREYENDIGKSKPKSKSALDQCQRVAQVALPFLALYKPFAQLLAITLGAVRVISCTSYLIDAIKSGEKSAIRYAMLQTAIAAVSVASEIFAHPVGMLITTGQDLIVNASQLVEALNKKDYKKALEVSAHILNNSLHLALFFTGALEILAASLSVQILLGLYQSSNDFKNGDYLEGCAHLLMAGIRTQQLKTQIGIIKMKWEIKALLGKIELVDVLMKYGTDPHNPALKMAVLADDIEAVKCLLDSGFDVNTSANSETPFLFAVIHKQNFEISNLLISKGADVNKNLPLHKVINTLASISKPWAGVDEYIEKRVCMIEFLLKNGANPALKDYWGNALQTAYKIPQNFNSIENAKKQVINALIKHGAKE